MPARSSSVVYVMPHNETITKLDEHLLKLNTIAKKCPSFHFVVFQHLLLQFGNSQVKTETIYPALKKN